MLAPMKLLVAAVVLSSATAHATGLCEDMAPSYDPPELFDEKTQSFAIPGTQPWCDEVQDGGSFDEKRGSVKFVELRDIHDTVLGIVSTASGDDADKLRRAFPDFEAVPFGKLRATLVKRGYVKLAPKTKSCTFATAWTDIAPPGGWRDATLQLDVKRAGKGISRTKLGVGSIQRRGDQKLRVHVIAKLATVAVFATVPSCAGPPPGYFGPDDGGSCYHVDTPSVLLLEASAVAACFSP